MPSSRSCQRRWLILFFSLFLVLGFLQPPALAAPLRPEILHYRVSASLFRDAGRAVISLRQVGPDLYEGEIRGETSGAVALFSGGRRDSCRTTMELHEGRLRPRLYIEESWVGRKHRYKEYRFDYDRGRLELWRREKGGALVLAWQTDLAAPIYDPITAFYTFRSGGFGDLKDGEILTVAGIPYPQPETVTIQMGTQEKGARQATVHIRQRVFDNAMGQVRVQFDEELIPLSAWTRVALFGTISGRLVDRY